jgi:Bacterial regulatory protein, Fis family
MAASSVPTASRAGQALDELVALLLSTGVPYEEAVIQFRKRWLTVALRSNRCNQLRTARALGIHRNTLGRQLQHFGISARERRPSLRATSSSRKRDEACTAGIGQPFPRDQNHAGERANSVRKGGRGESPEQSPAAKNVGGSASAVRLAGEPQLGFAAGDNPGRPSDQEDAL